MSRRLLSVEEVLKLRFTSRDSGKPARLVDGRERVRTYVRRRMKTLKRGQVTLPKRTTVRRASYVARKICFLFQSNGAD